MATITEDYCDFETAKLLKEKGFDTAVRHYYQKIDDDITYHIEDFRNWNVYDMWYSIPTLQMAMKWLREVHKLFIEIKMSKNTFLWGYRVSISNGSTSCLHANNFNKYEEACEAAIKYCLEHLI